jgi:hypothetical protein
MSPAATQSVPSDRTTQRPAGNAIDPARAAILRAANINPRTGLATDYLNHFNEAVMLLEMVPDIPECAEDFLEWSPLTYPDHFTHTNFKARDLAIEAYELADPKIRAQFDNLATSPLQTITPNRARCPTGRTIRRMRPTALTKHRQL